MPDLNALIQQGLSQAAQHQQAPSLIRVALDDGHLVMLIAAMHPPTLSVAEAVSRSHGIIAESIARQRELAQRIKARLAAASINGHLSPE